GFARNFDLTSAVALKQALDFAESVMTNVGASDMVRRLESLHRGSARNPATAAEQAALDFAKKPTYAGLRRLLAEIGDQAGVRNHRPGILRGCMRALQLAEAPNGPTFYDAAVRVREQSRAIGRQVPPRSVGSTLILKGLEADVSVVLTAGDLSRRNLYVAMT